MLQASTYHSTAQGIADLAASPTSSDPHVTFTQRPSLLESNRKLPHRPHFVLLHLLYRTATMGPTAT